MKKTEARTLIYDRLEPVVAAAGFRANRKAEGFVRKIDGGRQILGVPIWDHNPLIEFSLTLSCRLDAVQAIVNRFSGSPPKYHAETLTSITQLEFLGVPGEPGRGVVYRAETEAQLDAVLAAIAELVRERVLSFFDEYRDLASLDRGLNPEDAEAARDAEWPDRSAFDATNQPYRSMIAVAVAFLAGNPRVPTLVAAHRARLRGATEHDLRKFEQVVAHLTGTAGPALLQ